MHPAANNKMGGLVSTSRPPCHGVIMLATLPGMRHLEVQHTLLVLKGTSLITQQHTPSAWAEAA